MNKALTIFVIFVVLYAIGYQVDQQEPTVMKAEITQGNRMTIQEAKEDWCDATPMMIEEFTKVAKKGELAIYKEAVEHRGKERPPVTAVEYTLSYAIDEILNRLSAGDNPEHLKVEMLTTCYSSPYTLKAKVYSLIDGDTFKFQYDEDEIISVRLYGIDAPELNQSAGLESRIALMTMAEQQVVSIESVNRDRYGRLVGKVSVDGKDLSLEMLTRGHAWHYKKYDDTPEYAAAEEAARSAKVGLWSESNPIPPWEYRTK